MPTGTTWAGSTPRRDAPMARVIEGVSGAAAVATETPKCSGLMVRPASSAAWSITARALDHLGRRT